MSPLESSRHSLQLEERPRSKEDPAQPESKLDHLKENRKFSPKLTHRQPNSVSSENHVAQKTFQKAEETALNICTRQHEAGARTMASKRKCGTWARIPVPHSDFIVESS